jgi:hypothetical protein
MNISFCLLVYFTDKKGGIVMATTKKTIHKSKKENKYQNLMSKLMISMILYILIIVFLNFGVFNGEISAFLKKNLFYNADVKNTISNISEMYNNKVVPVINNFSDVND